MLRLFKTKSARGDICVDKIPSRGNSGATAGDRKMKKENALFEPNGFSFDESQRNGNPTEDPRKYGSEGHTEAEEQQRVEQPETKRHF